MLIRTIPGLLVALMCAMPLTAVGQGYPERPIRLILAVAPGGGQDTIARAMGQKLGDKLGNNIIIDNRPGGGGNIGILLAAQAAPDGYTLLMISSSAVIYPLVYGPRYDLDRDFVAVSHLVNQPYLVIVNPSVPVKSITELIAYAKSNPGRLNHGSGGQGSLTHLAGELLKARARIEWTHVAYKGMGPAYFDLIAGHVQLAFGTIVSSLPHVRANRLRALAVSSAERAKSVPDVPTVAESGVPGFAVTQWYGILAPTGTPRRAVDRLNREIVAVLHDPDIVVHVTNDGAQPVGSSSLQFERHLKAEREQWSRVVKQTGIRQ